MPTQLIPHFSIRPVRDDDKAAWYALWRAYCGYYDVALDERVTARTWERIVSAAEPIHALIAYSEDGTALGLCNYVLHPNTWSDQTVCYLEDLYVAPAGRRQGIATAFVERLKAIGVEQNWFRIYWVTNQENTAAQAVYDPIATRTGYVRYEIAMNRK
ncbi:GNAT family N-acetyltransferase [Paraburkholderia sp. J67]|uniref:GNAT family N-acetyltransferase n=1 Tax=Paraburkholderia sp. J67 TaxID=2805435 RepID=UPI002ABDC3BD|nr:GNAT family N-acetyltransferase [Paraburkholderia sp. J67]